MSIPCIQPPWGSWLLLVLIVNLPVAARVDIDQPWQNLDVRVTRQVRPHILHGVRSGPANVRKNVRVAMAPVQSEKPEAAILGRAENSIMAGKGLDGLMQESPADVRGIGPDKQDRAGRGGLHGMGQFHAEVAFCLGAPGYAGRPQAPQRFIQR